MDFVCKEVFVDKYLYLAWGFLLLSSWSIMFKSFSYSLVLTDKVGD